VILSLGGGFHSMRATIRSGLRRKQVRHGGGSAVTACPARRSTDHPACSGERKACRIIS
jgi:hypothetical protein